MSRQLHKRIRETSRSRLAELQEGVVSRVIGRTALVDLDPACVLAAPFSGRPCVYYDASVETRSGLLWSALADHREGVPFLIQDGTARAVIEPEEADIELANLTRTGPFTQPSPRELVFLRDHMLLATVVGRPMRFRESIIGIGELIAVLGAGIREGDPLAPPPPDYRSEPPTRLRFAGSRDHRLLISDHEDVVLAP